jgi:hypothetical protein
MRKPASLRVRLAGPMLRPPYAKPTRRQPTRKPGEIVNWVYSDTVTGETMLLRAVIEETKSEIVVITVYKTSKLKKYLPKE